MLITLLLMLGGIVLLCLMILTAIFFMPYRGLVKNFPQDVQEALKPRLDQIDRQPKAPRIVGGILLILLCGLFAGLFLLGGIDGMHHDFTFRQFLLRYLVIAFGIKAFDILALDYFLLTKSNFFPHFFPETKNCAGWQQFGYNRKQQLTHIIMMLVFCIAAAAICAKY